MTTRPDEDWEHFVGGSEPNWSKTVIAGGSLGAGEAVLIAQEHAVHRVALFAGWTDARHGWVAIGATPSDRFRALIHAQDRFYSRTC